MSSDKRRQSNLKMVEEGEKLLEITNQWLSQNNKYEIALREARDKNTDTKSKAVEVAKRVDKGYDHLLAKAKEGQLQTKTFLLEMSESKKGTSKPEAEITEDEDLDEITREKKGRGSAPGRAKKDDSGIYSADSTTIDEKEIRRVGMNLEEEILNDEQSAIGLRTAGTSLTGSLISQCASDLERTNLYEASEQTNQTNDSNNLTNISPDPPIDYRGQLRVPLIGWVRLRTSRD